MQIHKNFLKTYLHDFLLQNEKPHQNYIFQRVFLLVAYRKYLLLQMYKSYYLNHLDYFHFLHRLDYRERLENIRFHPLLLFLQSLSQ